MGKFNHEHHAGKGRTHGAAENGAHADQRPEASPFVGQKAAQQSAQRAAHHEQRSQHATRCSRAE